VVIVRTRLERLQRAGEAAGRELLVAAVILDASGRAFTPRRSPVSRMLPDLWDLVGGHVEPGESLLEALMREVSEETGWIVRGEPSLLHVADWEVVVDSRTRRYREFDFVVDVDGDLDAPELGGGEHTDFRWVGHDDLELFDANQGRDDGLVRRIVEAGLRYAAGAGLTQPHATLFAPPAVADVLDDLRQVWDPAMASQIRPHVTVTYPDDVPDLDELEERVAAAAEQVSPFVMQVSSPVHDGDPARGIAFRVEDPDGGWGRLRRLISGGMVGEPAVAPHLTMVHPRTSGLGATAWPEFAELGAPELAFRVDGVCVTAFDGKRWATIDRYGLTG
jgi:8-oxo-dGTP diphosphatase